MAIIGIDLGTTNSLASVWTKDGVKLIPNVFGEYLTPSIVSFDEKGQIYVGKIAKERLITNPDRTFREFKRTMGTDKKYSVGLMAENEYRSEELSAFVLKQLKEDAERFLGEPVQDVIISVPAYFDDNQRNATRNAGLLAGLNVQRLINEPSAAALSHYIQEESTETTFLVFDFGGGTLDVSIVDAFDNVVEIQAVAGDNTLGGKDFNQVIADYFYYENNIDKTELSTQVQATILKEAELCKIALSKKDEVSRIVHVEGKEYVMTMTNQKLINISEDLFKRMVKTVERAINDSGLMISDIDKVILVGGSSNMPIVRHYLSRLFKHEVFSSYNPEEIVAMGVGVVAGIKMRDEGVKELVLSDICPFTLGIEIAEGHMSPIIPRNEVLPCSRTERYNTVHDNQKQIDIPIYQGEDFIAKNNLRIGEMSIPIPKAPAGQVNVLVTFTYDINGILDVDVLCENNGAEFHKTIINEKLGYSEAEIEMRVAQLQAVKISNSANLKLKALFEEAQRLYVEASPEMKKCILECVRRFKSVVDTQKSALIKKESVKFALFLEMVEQRKFKFDDVSEEVKEDFKDKNEN